MRPLYFIIPFVFLALLSGCNDWLDVKPRSQTRADKLFETEDGYKTALTGVYIGIADQSLYGRNTSMYIPEAMARNWSIPTMATTEVTNKAKFNNTLNKFSNFNFKFEVYDDSELLLKTVWLNYYNAIAQLNNILENIETSTIEFRYNNDKLIKGEALGLRAFLHLDVLRLWGPIPTDAGTKGIPYTTEMSKDPNKLTSKTYQEVLDLLIKDLDDAEKLLETDPILNYTMPTLNYRGGLGAVMPEDSWQHYRQMRFNYFAVLATKARFYNWIGNKEKAVEYAKKVIEAKNTDGTSKFNLANEMTYQNTFSYPPSLIMIQEHLFCVHNPDLQPIIKPLFVDQYLSFSQSVGNLDIAYESKIHGSDIRYKPDKSASRYWELKNYQGQSVNHFKKFTGNNDIESPNQVPLLRLCEMYFIVMENLPIGEFMPYFQEYRIARILDISIESGLTDQNALLLRLEKEYRKEFFGEGQMFFFYKKHNYKAYTWPNDFTLPANAYELPRPKEQQAFE